MSKILTSTTTLPIADAYVAQIQVVASMNGWKGTGTPEEYISSLISKRMRDMVDNLFYPAIDGYFGVAGATEATALKTVYDGNLKIVTAITDVPSPVIIPTTKA